MSGKFKLLLMIILATAIEYYDYGIFAYIAVYISKSLIITKSNFILDIFAYSLIAIGAIMRPIGGVFVAHFGDKYGRANVFRFIIVLSIFCSFSIALLPTPKYIGYTAMVLLIVFRLLQGIAVGSEFPSALIFAYEIPPAKYKPLYCAVPSLGNNLGLLLASVVAGVLLNYNTNIGVEFWRLAFVFGGVLGVLNYFIRKDLNDSDEYLEYVARYKIKYPIVELVKTNKKLISMLFMFGLFVLTCVAFYLLFATQILSKYYHLPINLLQKYNSYFVVALIIGSLASGFLANLLGKKIIALIIIVILLLSYAGFYYYQLLDLPSIKLIHIFICLLLGVLCGRFSILLANSFSPHVRFSGIALVYGLCALCNGCYMVIIDILMRVFGNNLLTPFYYLLACGILAIISLFGLNKKLFINI